MATYNSMPGGKMTRPIHQSITCERVMEAAEREMVSLDNPGFCLSCGEEAEGVEPDARYYECDHCGIQAVFGASECLIGGMYNE